MISCRILYEAQVIFIFIFRQNITCFVDSSPVFSGLLSHYLRIGEKLKGIPLHTSVHTNESSGGKHSSLVVLETLSVILSGSAAEQWGLKAYESQIRLITGRTHQACYSEAR